MTKPPIPPNVLDELIRWLSQQSKPRDSDTQADGSTGVDRAEIDTARATVRRVVKRRILYGLMKRFDVDERLLSIQT